jgi:hypothetical protein
LVRVVHPNHSGEWRTAHHIQDIAESFLTDTPAFYDCTFTRLITLPYYAAMDPHHPLAKQASISLQDLKDYPVMVFGLMLMKEYKEELQHMFHDHPERLTIRNDVDNQVEAAFSLKNTHIILIGANPFIRQTAGLSVLPLSASWQRTYGILYHSPVSPVLQKYIDLAIAYYKERGMTQNKKSA